MVYDRKGKFFGTLNNKEIDLLIYLMILISALMCVIFHQCYLTIQSYDNVNIYNDGNFSNGEWECIEYETKFEPPKMECEYANEFGDLNCVLYELPEKSEICKEYQLVKR